MREIISSEFSYLLKRIPAFELSYETMTHKKVSEIYDIGLAIPQSKKYILWFTFYEDRNVCVLMELNKEKRIVRIQMPNINFPHEFAYGTLFYGSLIRDTDESIRAFIIEDILWYAGISLQKSLCNERLAFIRTFFQKLGERINGFQIYLAHFFKVSEVTDMDISKIPYDVHHLQYRAFSTTAPYVNLPRPSPMQILYTSPAQLPKKPTEDMSSKTEELFIRPPPYRMNVTKAQYRYPAIFQVMADSAFDIYHLYAFGKGNSRVYYNTAYIPNYKTSVFMNSLFRNIKENRNLDLIEESDDEEEFQNRGTAKFVDLEKVIIMECTYLPKFRRWVPIRVAPRNAKIIHIGML
jgi:hypothetical protein